MTPPIQFSAMSADDSRKLSDLVTAAGRIATALERLADAKRPSRSPAEMIAAEPRPRAGGAFVPRERPPGPPIPLPPADATKITLDSTLGELAGVPMAALTEFTKLGIYTVRDFLTYNKPLIGTDISPVVVTWFEKACNVAGYYR